MRISKEIFSLAEKQFMLDCNCQGDDNINLNKIFINKSKAIPGARLYEGKDLFFKAITFLGKAFIMVDDSIYDWAIHYFKDVSPEWFCLFPNLRNIDRKLQEFNREIADTHVYFLPDADASHVEANQSVKWFEKDGLVQFKENNPFPHALCFSNTQPDVLAVAAMEGDKMIAMAGASMDGEFLWQIGIDVLTDYRRKGLAVNLTALIKQEILKRGKIPFYGTSESHSVSQSVAIKAGFAPAWAEVYTRRIKH